MTRIRQAPNGRESFVIARVRAERGGNVTHLVYGLRERFVVSGASDLHPEDGFV
jgi:hypothetical protein